MHIKRVLALLALLVGLAHCFLWDIVVGGENELHFYYNGIQTYAEYIRSINQLTSVTYDPVNYRVLLSGYSDQNLNNFFSILSFDLSSRTIESLFTKTPAEYDARVVYDPVTQLLVWRENYYNIYTFSLNPASSNKTSDGHLLITLDHKCLDVAVDSCGGYIYWITEYNIERVRLDGSEREVFCIVDRDVAYRHGLAIDQHTQTVYWIERKLVNGDDQDQDSIKSSNFNGMNKSTLYNIQKGSFAGSLAISKDFIYWQHYNEQGTWQLPKNSSDHVAKKLNTHSSLRFTNFQLLAARYSRQEQIQGIKSCEALQSLIPNNSKPASTVSICQNYCLDGNCSVNAEEQPTCSCEAGYYGKRCEVNSCHQYCLHNGSCSLNEEDEPSCECTADYEGERCDVAVTHAGECADTTQQALQDLRSGVKEVLKEELKRILHLFSDRLDGDEAKC